MSNKYKLKSCIKIFKIDGITMIGHPKNEALIGLDEEGIDFVSKILDEDEIDINSLSENNANLLNAMIENNYFEDDTDPKYLSTVYLHVTDNCNLHCVGCYSFKEHRNEKKDLTLDEIISIIDKLLPHGVNNLVISGGEPFLRKDLSEILKHAKEVAKIEHVTAISNGTMPNESYDPCLPYLDDLSISIDGYDVNSRFIRDPGIMPKVFETINYLKDKIQLSLIATLHKKTLPFADKFMELSKKLDIPLSFSVLTADYKNPDFKDFLLDENDYEQMNNIGLPKDNRDSHKPQEDNDIGIQCRDCCPVGHRSISIGADGSIYPCHMLHVKDLVMGNILTDDMYKILDNKTNMFASLSVDNMEKCNICEYKYICGGGCRATSYYKYGNFFSPDADCENFHSVFSKKIKDIKNKCNIE